MSAMKNAWPRLLVVLLAMVCGTVLGCGDDDNDFLVSRGSGLSALGGTGSLLFSFATAQSATVPGQSTTLALEFFEENRSEKTTEEEPLLRDEQAFASSVVVSGVPVSARRVRITFYDPEGRPLVQLTDDVVVQAAQTTPVDLSDAKVEQVTPTEFRLEPAQGQLFVGESLQIELLVSYSNGEQVSLTAEQIPGQIVFEVAPAGVVKIDRSGRLTALSSGLANITAIAALLGSFRATIRVTES